MAYDDVRNRDPDITETHDLIASDKVEGTKVGAVSKSQLTDFIDSAL